MEHICTLPGLVSQDTCRHKSSSMGKAFQVRMRDLGAHQRSSKSILILWWKGSPGSSSSTPGRSSYRLELHSDHLLLVCAPPTHEVTLPTLCRQTHVSLMCFPLKRCVIKIEKRKHQDGGKTNLKGVAYGGPWLLADDCTPTELHPCSFLLHIFHPAVWICHAKAITWNTSQRLAPRTILLQDIPKTGTHQPRVVLHLILVTPHTVLSVLMYITKPLPHMLFLKAFIDGTGLQYISRPGASTPEKYPILLNSLFTAALSGIKTCITSGDSLCIHS